MSCLPHHENVNWDSSVPLWIASAGYFVPVMRKISATWTLLSVLLGHKRLISLLREALSFFFLTAWYVAAILKQRKRITEGESSLGDQWELADAFLEWSQSVGLPWFNKNICIGQALSLDWARCISWVNNRAGIVWYNFCGSTAGLSCHRARGPASS